MSFDPDVATQAYLATLSTAASARSDAYFEGGYWLILWDLLVAIGLAAVLLGTGLSQRMRSWGEGVTQRKWLQTTLYGLQYVVVSTLLLLPWAAYEDYFREHRYGLSNQTPITWLLDQGKGLLLDLVFVTLAISLIYAVIRKARKTYWLWGTLVAVSLLTFQIVLSPIYLEPIFNKFYPLAEGPIKQSILALARANAIPVHQVYEFDASKQTTKMSAHVSGLMGTAQISLNDNLMQRGSPEEIRAVLGHEMGHYVLNHSYLLLLLIGIITLVGFALLPWAFDRTVRYFGQRWGLRGVDDVAGVPLLILLCSCYLFLLTPIKNTLIRTTEAEADAYGMNAAREPDGFAQAALHLAEYRKMRPSPLEEIVFFDHPSGWHRIHRAMVWKAENIEAADIAGYDAKHHPPGTH